MIMLRVKEGKGRHPFYPAVLASNGTVKPFYARIAGKEILRDDGVYYLRYTDAHSKRHYQFVGTDPKLARTMQYQRQHVIAGEAIGLRTVEPPPAPRPERIVPSELPSVLSLVNAGVPPPEFASKRLAVAATIDKFVRETAITRNAGTAADYRSKLGAFLKVCKKAYVDEIGDDEVISFVAALNHRDLSARTIENHCVVLNTFLRRYGFKDRVTKRLVPQSDRQGGQCVFSLGAKSHFCCRQRRGTDSLSILPWVGHAGARSSVLCLARRRF